MPLLRLAPFSCLKVSSLIACPFWQRQFGLLFWLWSATLLICWLWSSPRLRLKNSVSTRSSWEVVVVTVLGKHWELKWPLRLHLWQFAVFAGQVSPIGCVFPPHRLYLPSGLTPPFAFCLFPGASGWLPWQALLSIQLVYNYWVCLAAVTLKRVTVTVTIFLSLPLWLCDCHCHCVTVTVIVSLSLRLCHCVTITVSLSLSLSLCHCHCNFITVTVTVMFAMGVSRDCGVKVFQLKLMAGKLTVQLVMKSSNVMQVTIMLSKLLFNE